MNKQQKSGLKLLIVMGVSGTGKSTIAKSLAQKLNYHYLEADDFHTEQAKKSMMANIPLTDEMRAPWIDALINALTILHQEGKHVVMAYSGLKYKHRQRFRELSYDCRYFYLRAEQKIIANRLNGREGHFFQTELLSSQFLAMEAPKANEADIFMIDGTKDISSICQEIYRELNEQLSLIK